MLPFIFRPLKDPGDLSLAAICPLLELCGRLFPSCFGGWEHVHLNTHVSESCALLSSRITDGNFMI